MTTQMYLLFSPHWDDVANEVGKRMEWDEETDWSEHAYIVIDPIGYNFDTIDSVMVFADGTIEFHQAVDEGAYNWADYPIEIVSEVLLNTYQSLYRN